MPGGGASRHHRSVATLIQRGQADRVVGNHLSGLIVARRFMSSEQGEDRVAESRLFVNSATRHWRC